MSHLFGPIRQIAFVVRDLDAALQYWTEVLGVGPFFVAQDVLPENFYYRGHSSPPPALTIALGNSGDVQVELVKQHDDHPSAYRDYSTGGREGLQHVSAWLTPADYDATRTRMLANGVQVAHEGTLPGNGIRFAYFATDNPGGFMYEIADLMQPEIYPLCERIAEAARHWDGSSPVRDLSDLADLS